MLQAPGSYVAHSIAPFFASFCTNSYLVDNRVGREGGAKLLEVYHELTRVWNHPYMLQAKKEKDAQGRLRNTQHLLPWPFA